MIRGQVLRQIRSASTWLVVGFFALLSGLGFLHSLNEFIDQSAQALAVPPPVPVNINQLLIRRFFLHTAIVALLTLPLLTSRAYADRGSEDASTTNTRQPGHTRMALATFLASSAIYILMLIVTACLVGVLFVYGSPEWGSIISGYLGLLLMGAAFISVGLFISSLATSPGAAGVATFAISLALGAAPWLARSGVPSARPVFQYFSVADAFDDFGKGVLDTGHLIACLSIIAMGLFLTTQTFAPHRADGRADR